MGEQLRQGGRNEKGRALEGHDSATQKPVGNMAGEDRGIDRPLISRYMSWENRGSIKKLRPGRGVDLSKCVA